jgi:uncharacterized membrane protein (UPF0127 family)
MKQHGLLCALLLLPLGSRAEPLPLCHVSAKDGGSLLLPVARSWAEQEQGLSGVLDAGPGMLFLWQEAKVRSLWMKNTHMPLSAAFIAVDGRVQAIIDLEPESLDFQASPGPVRAIVEVPRGDFERLGIHTGSAISIQCEEAAAPPAAHHAAPASSPHATPHATAPKHHARQVPAASQINA